MSEQPDCRRTRQPPEKIIAHLIVDSVSGMEEQWEYGTQDSDELEDKFSLLNANKEVAKSAVYELVSVENEGEENTLIDEYEIDQHDEPGYRIGAIAVLMINRGYEKSTVIDRLRKNADLLEENGSDQ